MNDVLPYYLDCNATSPIEPEVLDLILYFTRKEYGNAGSQSHDYGAKAKRAVNVAREQIAGLIDCNPVEVLFTSGATESDNLAILGLAPFAKSEIRPHFITTAIEHKAVLEPFGFLSSQGFDTTILPVSSSGRLNPDDLESALRPDTCLVSVMHVNNETGVEQPLAEICDALRKHSAFLHVDAAQGFGKSIQPLRNDRIDLLSVSAHKIYGPKGVGALIARRRKMKRPPLVPLQYGGGQEKGLRPGTLPVPLIAGLGMAAELAVKNVDKRTAQNKMNQKNAIAALEQVGAQINGDLAHVLHNTLNVSIPGLNSEAAMVALKGVAALSNGSACTSTTYKPSHVLQAMSLEDQRIEEALRFSWCHLSGDIDWRLVTNKLQMML
jgi:cysteine desulfurase